MIKHNKDVSLKIILPLGIIFFILLLLNTFQRPIYMDETNFLNNVRTFMKNYTLVPTYTRYPTFYSYLVAIPVGLTLSITCFLAGYPLAGLKSYSFFDFVFEEHLLSLTWVARGVTIVSAVILIVTFLKFAQRTYGLRTMVFTSVILICDPYGYFIKLAGYGLPDIPVTLMGTISLLLCFRYLDTHQRKFIYWASFLCGLSASTKLNGIFIFFPLTIVPVLAQDNRKLIVQLHLRILLLIILGFFIGSPALLYSFESYKSGIVDEADILLKVGSLASFGGKWIWHFKSLWMNNPFMFTLMGLSFLYCFYKRTNYDLIFLCWFIPSFMVLGMLEKKSMWYFVIFYPFIALNIARVLNALYEKVDMRGRKVMIVHMIAFSVLTMSVWIMGQRILDHIKPDNRTIAQRWIYRNIPNGASMVVNGRYIPQLYAKEGVKKYFRAANPEMVSIRRVKIRDNKYKNLIEVYYSQYPILDITLFQEIDYQCDQLNTRGAQHLLTSSKNYLKFFPSDISSIPQLHNPRYDIFMKRKSFYECIFSEQSNYSLLKSFSSGSGPVVNVYKRKN